jgi:hypothetical protein
VGAAQGAPLIQAPAMLPDMLQVCGVLLTVQRGWVAVQGPHTPEVPVHSGVVPEQVCVTDHWPLWSQVWA